MFPILVPILGKIGGILIKSIPTVVGIVKSIFSEDERTNEEIRNMQSYNPEDNSITQMQNLNSILNDIKDNKKSQIKKLEETFISNLENYFNSIESFIKENNQLEEFNSYSLKANCDKLIKDFKNSFYDDINNKISLSDYKCLSILEIKASEKRKVEMNSYIDEIIKNSFDKYFEDLDFITNNTIEFIQRNINRVMKNNEDSIKNIKKEIEANMQLSESEIEEKRKDYDKKEEVINSLLDILKIK
ncbi:hypothetical protein [Brachyspira aalborgi]|jgi:hypothetical protein|uniref:Uncharacterized protein n=1 Tax=Brachyspira aalborgi TaxID=29522 RepID=A0AB38PV01_9SPIR|nr:hypothetical protein [Brachyspira aalborgi]MBS4764049.1 hypothetical protein [Brachyspira sp.]TXJ23805.1 hypothetical protein EPJ73_08005 [Brachyspira aalborgi]TXJ48040.1 hypothetical protein EPJ75_09805 [Brachyspira aalborgi]CCY78718.1 unknown [Brachyspira sp. CAG:700]